MISSLGRVQFNFILLCLTHMRSHNCNSHCVIPTVTAQAPLQPLLEENLNAVPSSASNGAPTAEGEEAVDREIVALLASATARGDNKLDGPAVLVVQALEVLLCNTKQMDMQRLAAFIKRLVMAAAATSCGEAVGLLAVVNHLLRRYPRLLGMMEWEGDAPIGGEFCAELMYPPAAAFPWMCGLLGLSACLLAFQAAERYLQNKY